MTRRIDGITITVTGIEKTVADCFKFRNKIGLDVAVEALREARASKEFDRDAFWRFADIARVANVVRPYTEALA